MNAKTVACSTATNENHALIATSYEVSSLEELLSIALRDRSMAGPVADTRRQISGFRHQLAEPTFEWSW